MATRVLGGFLVLFPIGIAVFFLAKAVASLHGVSVEVAESIPREMVGLVPVVTLVGVFLLLLLMFGIGVLLAPGRRPEGGIWLERRFLNRIPGYALVRSTVLGTVGVPGDTGLQPGILRRFDGVEEIVLILDELPDSRVVVFLPNSPVPASGRILVVRSDLVEAIEADVAATLKVFTDWSEGAARILGPVRA